MSPKKEHKRNIKNIPHFFTKNEIRNQKTFEKDRNLITDNNIMKIEKEIQKQYKKERDILVYKQKTKKKLILRKDLYCMGKHQANEASKVDLNNSNPNSGHSERNEDKKGNLPEG